MWKKYLQRVVLIAIAILSVKTGIENFESIFAKRINDTAVIAGWEKRLSKLIEPIPFKRGLVGYLSISDMPNATLDASDAEGEFVLAQYTIAPLILVRGAEQEWNILNLDPETFEQWREENADDFELIRSGGGMYLVRKVKK
jgi:hypothetical protein